MAIDEREFFREATLRICGSLDIEKALWRCFLYLRDSLPAEGIFLNFFHRETGCTVVFASADVTGGHFLDIRIPHIPEQQEVLLDRDQFQDLLFLNRVAPGSIADIYLRTVGFPESSLISMRLRVEGELMGNVILVARGEGRFSAEHARLLSLLKEPLAIAVSNNRRYRELLELKERLAEDYRHLQNELLRLTKTEIVGADLGLREVFDLVRHVAPLPSPVILVGETGVGKEVIARAIHNLSPRRKGLFVKVDCGAIPETLVDSELFGHERGAFTGAHTLKQGRFERAKGGTIFLDEIGELLPEGQVRLLRVLQDREIERVGGTRPIKVDIRVIAATHRDLEEMVREGLFREDLYYRIHVFPIYIPPLRQRKTDIPALLEHFIRRKSSELNQPAPPPLAPGVLHQLLAYPWPGNVRELDNAVERAVILSQGHPLTFDDLKSGHTRFRASDGQPREHEVTLDTMMSEHIRRTLAITGGRVEGPRGAARMLGIDPGTLRHRMRKLGIPFGRRARSQPA